MLDERQNSIVPAPRPRVVGLGETKRCRVRNNPEWRKTGPLRRTRPPHHKRTLVRELQARTPAALAETAVHRPARTRSAAKGSWEGWPGAPAGSLSHPNPDPVPAFANRFPMGRRSGGTRSSGPTRAADVPQMIIQRDGGLDRRLGLDLQPAVEVVTVPVCPGHLDRDRNSDP
jgi:hypothetical protein